MADFPTYSPARRLFVWGLMALLWTGVLTSSSTDPTWLNPYTHSQGLHNVLGLSGALVLGTLVEWLGVGALLLPLVVWRKGLAPATGLSWPAFVTHGLGWLVFTSTAWALLFNTTQAGLGGPGLVGMAAATWLMGSLGRMGALLLILLGWGLAAWSLVRRPEGGTWLIFLAKGLMPWPSGPTHPPFSPWSARLIRLSRWRQQHPTQAPHGGDIPPYRQDWGPGRPQAARPALLASLRAAMRRAKSALPPKAPQNLDT